MKGFVIRFGGEIKAAWLLRVKYPLEYLFEWLGLILIFVVIYFGIGVLSQGGIAPAWGEEAAIRYALWVLCLEAIVLFPVTIEQEALTGTLEQLFLAPKGGLSLLIMRYVGGLLFQLIGTTLIFSALILVTQPPLTLNLGAFIVALIILIGVSGVGFFLGALALLFKRIWSLTNLMQMIFLGLAIVPVDRLAWPLPPLMKGLPLAAGLPLLNDLLLGRAPFWEVLARGEFPLLLLNSFFYLALGTIALKAAGSKARQRGLLGKY